MTSWRESLNSIPGTLTNFINETATTATHYLQNGVQQSLPGTPTTTATSNTNDRSVNNNHNREHKALPIPASLVKEQWRLIFTSDANAQDLQAAIGHCRDLVLVTDECSEERRWLVRHLVDLRYSLRELQDAEADHDSKDNVATVAFKTVVGHHFVVQQPPTNRLPAAAKPNYCDHCGGIIWSVVQAWHQCSDCGYLVHQKCIDSVVRVCAHVVASERQYPIELICPEIGLAAQKYKCAECPTLLNFKLPDCVTCFGGSPQKENSWIEPRLCDYSGLYYCPTCHWNDNSLIPARIVHNWDFTMRKVSRASLQEIKLFLDKPLIRLEDNNPKLFIFVDKLCLVKKLRQNLVHMRKYLAACKTAITEKLVDTQIGNHRHLIQSNEFYSINDLVQIESGSFFEDLYKVFHAFDAHIRSCNMCTAKAYICEICSNNEVIFPFDDGCVDCYDCNSIYHRVCMTRKNMICPKCVRLQERRLQLERKQRNGSKETDDDDEDDDK